jgi:hypothetical protein
MGLELHEDFTDAAMVAHDLQQISIELGRFHQWLNRLAHEPMRQRIVHTLTTEGGLSPDEAIEVGRQFEHLLGGVHAEVMHSNFQTKDMYALVRDRVIGAVHSARGRRNPTAANGLAVAS